MIVVLGYFLVTSRSYTSSSYSTSQNNKATQGKVAVSFTDATTNIQNISEVSMTVNKVELYSQTQGWVTVSNNSYQYQLLQLHAKGQTKIFAQAEVPVDTYSRIRVTLGDVVVHTGAGSQKTAAVPSKTLDIQGSVSVHTNETSSLKLDVLADKSLHVTARGDYVFAPVVNVESRSNAMVGITSDGAVTINGGSVDTSSSVGMDIDGNVKANFQLDNNAKLDVGSTGVINILDGTNSGVNATSSINGAVKSTIDGVINY